MSIFEAQAQRIVIIGAGHVGLVAGACFSEQGHSVTCVDKDECKIDRLRDGDVPMYEPGLGELIHNYPLNFTTDVAVVGEADIVLLTVGTPCKGDTGETDLLHIYGAAEKLAPKLKGHTTVAIKSTVPIGTTQLIAKVIGGLINPRASFSMVSNPEFLREGEAVNDFKNGRRILLGAESRRDIRCLAKLYQPISDNTNSEIIKVANFETAEFVKYASNCLMAVKISFINELAWLCEKQYGTNINCILEGMRGDRPGLKSIDTSVLIDYTKVIGGQMCLLEAAQKVIKNQPEYILSAERAKGFLSGLHQPSCIPAYRDLFHDRNSNLSELVKFATNSYLSVMTGMVCELALFCEKYDNIDFENVLELLRNNLSGIWGWSQVLHAGAGFGGSCLPKDALSLVNVAKSKKVPMKIIKTAWEINNNQPKLIVQRIREKLGNLHGRNITVLGLAFKENTDDVREAPALVIISSLIEQGAIIRTHDPKAINKAKSCLPKEVMYFSDPYEALHGADVAVLVVRWPEYMQLDKRQIREVMHGNQFFDLPSLYNPEEMEHNGFEYYCVGRMKDVTPTTGRYPHRTVGGHRLHNGERSHMPMQSQISLASKQAQASIFRINPNGGVMQRDEEPTNFTKQVDSS